MRKLSFNFNKNGSFGFTLIELLLFIVVSSMVATIILFSGNSAIQNAPNVHRQWVAVQVARGCMEWFLDQRRLNGYASLSCPSTPATTSCNVPSGYTASASITCSSYSGDSNYKTITVTVGGYASTSLSAMIGSY